MIALGVFLHAVGGFAAGSFYIPFKKVRNWAWESYWLVNGAFSWIIAPWIVALLVVPGLFSVPNERNQLAPFATMCGTWEKVSTLLTVVGIPNAPY